MTNVQTLHPCCLAVESWPAHALESDRLVMPGLKELAALWRQGRCWVASRQRVCNSQADTIMVIVVIMAVGQPPNKRQ